MIARPMFLAVIGAVALLCPHARGHSAWRQPHELQAGKYEWHSTNEWQDGGGRLRGGESLVTITVDGQDLLIDFGKKTALVIDGHQDDGFRRVQVIKEKEIHDKIPCKLLANGQLKGIKSGVYVRQGLKEVIVVGTLVIEGQVTDTGAEGTMIETRDGNVVSKGRWELKRVEESPAS